MHDFAHDNAQSFLEKIYAKPLFHAMGKPFNDNSVERVRTSAQFLKFIQAPMYSNVGTEANNYVAFLCRRKFGEEWFNKRWNENVSAARRLLDRRKTETKIANAISEHGFTRDESVIQMLYDDLLDVALGRGYGLRKPQSFALTWIEPWLLRGHAPCGWKGRLPALPKAQVGHSPYEGLRLDEVIGDGVLRVY